MLYVRMGRWVRLYINGIVERCIAGAHGKDHGVIHRLHGMKKKSQLQ